jgi:histidinol phosphatase-like enzyme
MVGDTLTDMQAGVAAGTGTVAHVRTGHGDEERAAVEAWAEARRGRDFPRTDFVDSPGELLPMKIEGWPRWP